MWHPIDNIRVFDTKRFFTEYEKASHHIEALENGTGYNWDRPCCWMAEGILVVGHNPDEGEKGNRPSVIALFDTANVTEEPYTWADQEGNVVGEGIRHYFRRIKTIPFDGFDISREEDQDPSFTPVYNEVRGSLYYDAAARVFITLGNQKGIYIADEEGKVLVEDPAYRGYAYSPGFRVLYKFEAEPEYAVTSRGLDEVLP
ncbi:MAG: hypothetical protein LBQ55_04100 [Treponema sp.]|nr:hypothetical protein [Treponema sp.]